MHSHERLLDLCLAVLYLGKRPRDSLVLIRHILLDFYLLVSANLQILLLEVRQLLYGPVGDHRVLRRLVPPANASVHFFVHVTLDGPIVHHACSVPLTIRVNGTVIIL